MDAVSDDIGVASAHVALAWLRQRPGVVEVPLLGARRPDQLGDNLDGLELVLGSEQLDRLDEVRAIELGFPQAFLGSTMVRRFSTSDHYDRLDNHRALHYGEFSVRS